MTATTTIKRAFGFLNLERIAVDIENSSQIFWSLHIKLIFGFGLKTIPPTLSLVTFLVTGFGKVLLLAGLFRVSVCLSLDTARATTGWFAVRLACVYRAYWLPNRGWCDGCHWTGLEMSSVPEEISWWEAVVCGAVYVTAVAIWRRPNKFV